MDRSCGMESRGNDNVCFLVFNDNLYTLNHSFNDKGNSVIFFDDKCQVVSSAERFSLQYERALGGP